MGKIKKMVKTRFIDEENGFEFRHEPVEDTLTIKKTPDGYEARYLVQDDDAQPPDEFSGDDESLFLVNFHRDFYVWQDKIITENDLRNWYRKDFSDYKEDPDNDLEDGKFPLEDDYFIFPLSCYIHSGVYLFLTDIGHGSTYLQHEGWDTSHVGAVLVSKKEWTDKEKAIEAAEGLVESWNQFLSGDVYGIVKESYNKDKEQCEQDSRWGFYGHKYALEALQTEI